MNRPKVPTCLIWGASRWYAALRTRTGLATATLAGDVVTSTSGSTARSSRLRSRPRANTLTRSVAAAGAPASAWRIQSRVRARSSDWPNRSSVACASRSMCRSRPCTPPSRTCIELKCPKLVSSGWRRSSALAGRPLSSQRKRSMDRSSHGRTRSLQRRAFRCANRMCDPPTLFHAAGPSVSPLTPATRAQLQIHFCVLLWGFTAILGKAITLAALPLVLWRMLLVVAALALIPQVWRGLRGIPPRLALAYAGIGVLVALHWLTFYGAIKLANASVGATCIALATPMTALVEPWLARRRFSMRELLLGVAVLPGVVLV